MNYQKGKRINTETTVCSTSNFVTSELFQSQNKQINRHTSILANENTNKFSMKSGTILKKITVQPQKQSSSNREKINLSFEFDSDKIQLIGSLTTILNRRKSYCFQIIKQFFIFPDQTASSNWSVSTYDKLIFHDQNIHTMVKIIETKTIQNKIWAFLNLKTLPKLKAAKLITQTVNQIISRNKRIIKKQSFQFLRQYSQGIQLRILKEKKSEPLNILETQSKLTKNNYQKCQQNIHFSSSTVSQQVRPIQRVKIQSPVKIYRYQKSTTSQYQKQRTQNTVPTSSTSARIIYPSQYHRYQQQKKQKINKYNIINYYQRPRTIINHHNRHHEYQFQNSRCHSTHCNCCEDRCFQSCQISRSCCGTNNVQKQNVQLNCKEQKCASTLNQTCFTQYKDQNSYNYQLSELQSRIQYLKFLQKVVKEQEMEEQKAKMN